MMEELQILAKKVVYGPFGPEDNKDAFHLIGKPILWANTKLALGSYGVLSSISSESYIIQYNNIYRKCKWIVSDEFGAV